MHSKLFTNKQSVLLVKALVALSALLFSALAQAHFPTLSCQLVDESATKLFCEAGYSDASLAGIVDLQVLSYDDELLSTVTTAADGTAELVMPEGEFYIKFDPGHESPAEFDYSEL